MFVFLLPEAVSRLLMPTFSPTKDFRCGTGHEGFVATISRKIGHYVGRFFSSGADLTEYVPSYRRVASDLSSFDTAKYHATVVPSKEGTRSFHLGEPITVQWQAPRTHSRKDWIGIYRVRIL